MNAASDVVKLLVASPFAATDWLTATIFSYSPLCKEGYILRLDYFTTASININLLCVATSILAHSNKK